MAVRPSLNRKLHASALQLNGTMPYAGLFSAPWSVYETAIQQDRLRDIDSQGFGKTMLDGRGRYTIAQYIFGCYTFGRQNFGSFNFWTLHIREVTPSAVSPSEYYTFGS